MTALSRWVVLLLAVVATEVLAQANGFCVTDNPSPDDDCEKPCICPPPPPPGPPPPPPPGGPKPGSGPQKPSAGPAKAPPPQTPYSRKVEGFDPVNMAYADTRDVTADIFVPGVRNLRFDRIYQAPGPSWEIDNNAIPRPFGTGMNTSTLWWSHSYSSYITPVTAYTWLREPNGRLIDYYATTCSAPCWVPNVARAQSLRPRLKWTGTSYELHRESGQYIYGAFWQKGTKKSYLLTEIRDRRGNAQITIAYESPSGLSCPAPDTGVGADPGAPYIRTITTAEGARLTFNYKKIRSYQSGATQECVISDITLLDRATSSEVPVATYTYTQVSGTEAGGRIEQADVTDGSWQYVYSNSEYTKKWQPDGQVAAAVPVMTHQVQSTLVRDGGGLGQDEFGVIWGYSVAGSDGGMSGALRLCCGTTCYTQKHQSWLNNARGGDGVDGGVLQRLFVIGETGTGGFHEARLVQTIDTCPGSNSCSPGTVHDQWHCGSLSNPGYEYANKDKRDNFVVRRYDDAGVGMPPALLEMKEKLYGATDPTGSNALSSVRYSWTYGTDQQQLIDTVEQDSVLGGGSTTAETKHQYDGNRLKATIRRGYTKVFNSATGTWANEERYVGTFYLTRRSCSGESTDDPFDRVLEVHGPCLVDPGSGLAATGCSTTLQTSYPVEQVEFYASGSTNNSGRLFKRIRYPNPTVPSGCAASAKLETTYANYDARGNAQTVTDENGIATTYTFDENRVTSATTDSKTWNFTYDSDRLSSTQYPEGNYEVSCYRTGVTPGGSCTAADGTFTNQLQWKAKFNSTKTSWSELVEYEYWPNGELKSETYKTPTETRRKLSYDSDAHRRPTYAKVGMGTGAFVRTSLFDGNDNRTGIGQPFNSPPPFCEGQTSTTAGTPQSRLCTSLWFDRANRLGHVDERPTASSGDDIRTCFEYDAQNNVSKVTSGCDPTATDGDCSSCTQPAALYQSDDFGNMVVATLPTHDDGSGAAGATHYEYSAAGEVLIKQTEQMEADGERIQYAHDQLGRVLSSTRHYSGGSEELYSFAYDDEGGTLDSSCGSTQYTKGRVRRKTDSFGQTWYRYNAFGRVLKEVRLRNNGGTQTTTCGTGLSAYADNPHTEYTYTDNGNRRQVTYPYGRVVTYNHGTGAFLDRVDSIDITTWDGSAWTTRTLIDDVVWEPYGGLRGYEILHHTTSNNSAVEYALGDDGTQAPSSDCPSAMPSSVSSDLTGRLRALRVSEGAFTPGSGSGEIYKRTYTWTADQVSRIDTCYLSATDAITEEYAYDRTLRLTSASRPTGDFANAGGPFSSRAYGYDKRGNRLTSGGLSEDAFATSLTYSAAPAADHLTQASSGTEGPLKTAFGYDRDGRVTSLRSGQYVDGGYGHEITFAYGAAIGVDTVFKAVTINGATFNYHYDAAGRRRYKAYPDGNADKYFVSAGGELLSDVSLTDDSYYDYQLDQFIEVWKRVHDDYIWLDERPVAVVRGLIENGWSRQSDESTSCDRVTEEGRSCGAYFPVTDHIAKPVLVLNSSRKIAGVGEFDPYGHVNRVAHHAGSAHPYANSTSSSLATLTQAGWDGGLALKMRVLFEAVDTEVGAEVCPPGQPCYSPPLDYATIKDPGGDEFDWAYGNLTGRFRSAWASPDAGTLVVDFTSGSTNCAPGQDCSTSTYPYTGVTIAGYEYARVEPGVANFSIPLRSPGQYFDEETDLVENWHRHYDPLTGRYLQPEPFLGEPRYVAFMARKGFTVPAYTFGLNNPLYWFDANGLYVWNRSFGFVWVKPENGAWFILRPGEKWDGNPDGVIGPSGDQLACSGKSSLPDNDVTVGLDDVPRCSGGLCRVLPDKPWPADDSSWIPPPNTPFLFGG